MIKINGTEIKTPSSFGKEFFNITKGARTADGTMHLDLVAKKRKFTLEWSLIKSADKDQILSLVYGEDMFVEIEYPEAGGVSTATVYAGAITAEKVNSSLYRDLTFDLIER